MAEKSGLNYGMEAMGPEQLRKLRQQAEKLLGPSTPAAYSKDGRTFGYQLAISSGLPVGCYVQLTIDDGRVYLGQILTQEIVERNGPQYGFKLNASLGLVMISSASLESQFVDHIRIRQITGEGAILCRLDAGVQVPASDEDHFEDGGISRAAEGMVTSYLSSQSAETSLGVGTALFTDGNANVSLRAAGFDRHTFLCGQSGSGKTFALGVIIEQLLLHTDLRIIILDPNSDFVHIRSPRKLTQLNKTRMTPLSAETFDKWLERWVTVSKLTRVIRPSEQHDPTSDKLHINFSDLLPDEQATVLKIDPLDDLDEFNNFLQLTKNLPPDQYSVSDILTAVGALYSAESRRIGMRIQNLGIEKWSMWDPRNGPTVRDILRGDWRCLVIDLGTVQSADEKSVISMTVLNHLWTNRTSRNPVLLVIDEAHNICPQDPASALEEITTQRVVQIAGEGRKFGLYLLLASQRPSKIHGNVLSLADNLVVMRMNAKSDVLRLGDIVSQVPFSLLEQCTNFKQGEAIAAGRIVPNPTLLKFGGRFTNEGGADIPTSWTKVQ